ncbi:signal transduction histidine kinase [Paucibacter oligotrophus]|uniref:histidine kinase n=1 Tax=Roseateles oligotrophus TaxID=1769250 RepID=A0A840LCC5_9BURK|nr:ATP-binding protein [Roseateles oligotrophus]MBB4844555.1 signal transduction histidine kinase [Roseateles oligotrophus]
MSGLFRYLLLILALGLLPIATLFGGKAQAQAAAQAPLPLQAPGQERLDLLPYLQIWVDAGARQGPQEAERQAFRPMQVADKRPGYSAAAFWLRLRLHNPGSQTVYRHLLMEPARLEEVALYRPLADGRWQPARAGTSRPFGERELALRESAFIIELAPGQTQTLLLRVASRSSVALEATLWEPRTLQNRQPGGLWLDGLLVGIALILMLLSLMMSRVLREPAALYIAAHLLLAILYESGMRGTSFMILWPNATDWATRSLAILGGLAVLGQWLAVRRLLRLRRRQPRLHRSLSLLAGLGLLSLGLCLFGDYRLGTLGNSLLNSALLLGMLLACVRAARSGQRLAWAWLAALGAQALGMLPRYLGLLGLTPHGLLSDYAPPLMTELGCLLVLIALMRRFHAQHQRYERGLEAAVAERTQALAQATRHAQASDAAKGRLLGYIGHDLRAPLASVVHVARELRAGESLEADRRAIERSGLLLLDMIDELQRFAKAPESSAALEILPAPVYLHGLLHETVEQAQGLARSAGCRIELRLAADLPCVVELDAKRLRQVLFNLLSNAAKFSREGTIVLQAECRAPARLQIRVSDQGRGIAPDELPWLFEPFVRASSSAHLPGLGLGLSIARQMVQAMGGDIRVRSQLGEGSEFSFDMPLQLASEDEVLWPPLLRQPQLGEARLALVLDPCASAREALMERLSLSGYDCLQAADLPEALAIEAPLDLLIVEPEALPGASLQALGELRGRHGRMRILCCSRRLPPYPAPFWLCKPVQEQDWWAALA